MKILRDEFAEITDRGLITLLATVQAVVAKDYPFADRIRPLVN